MIKIIKQYASSLLDQSCCHFGIGGRKIISIGFGEKVFHNKPKLKPKYYGKWEMGSYHSAWRIIIKGKIFLSSGDFVEDTDKAMNIAESKLIGERLIDIIHKNKFDVRIKLSRGIVVDFFGITNTTDELFHVFCPDNIYLELLSKGDWNVCAANLPYSRPKN